MRINFDDYSIDRQAPDRTKDFRIICPKCGRDMGGTVAPRPGHKIRWVLCVACEHPEGPRAHSQAIIARSENDDPYRDIK